MKSNLDTLKSDIESYLQNAGFLIFRGFSRKLQEMPECEWDSVAYPDYKAFIDIAHELGVRLMVFHHRKFKSELLDRAIQELPEAGLEREEQRHFENRLKDLRKYDGFTCAMELSYEHSGTLYIFELRTPWYDELTDILQELDLAAPGEEDDEEGNDFGGYFSKN